MFFTGVFDLESSNTAQKVHDKEPWDDDVLSTLEDYDKKLFKDGYVSNAGNVVTIHIGSENLDRVADVKRWFSLDDGGLEVEIEPFAGWYQLKEVGGGITLFGKTGMPLISFFKEDPCRVHISYNNVNIDKEDLAIHAVGEYGEEHDCYVDCVSDAEQALCFSRFIELATNGFTSELRELIAMDWDDLERASFNSCAGRYYHATSSPQEIINALSKIRGKSLADCGTEACSIVCVDGNVSPFDFCMAVDPWELASSVIQLLYDETNEIQIDVWTFPIMNSDSI